MIDTRERDKKIYRAYIELRRSPKRSVSELCGKFRLSRMAIYNAVNRVKHGGSFRAIERDRLNLVWEHKYSVRYAVMPKNRKDETVAELRRLIREMKKDKFPVQQIAKKLGKHRSTIVHHLKV